MFYFLIKNCFIFLETYPGALSVFICLDIPIMLIISNNDVITKSAFSKLKAVAIENLNRYQWCSVHNLVFQILQIRIHPSARFHSFESLWATSGRQWCLVVNRTNMTFPYNFLGLLSCDKNVFFKHLLLTLWFLQNSEVFSTFPINN